MLYYDCYFLIITNMSLGKPGEDDVARSGAPLGSDVRSSVDSILSAEKPKNWSAEFRDFMTHYVGPETEELTVGKKMIVMTQNSQYECVVTDNGLKVEDRPENRKIR